jgi:hypothetical protein
VISFDDSVEMNHSSTSAFGIMVEVGLQQFKLGNSLNERVVKSLFRN